MRSINTIRYLMFRHNVVITFAPPSHLIISIDVLFNSGSHNVRIRLRLNKAQGWGFPQLPAVPMCVLPQNSIGAVALQAITSKSSATVTLCALRVIFSYVLFHSSSFDVFSIITMISIFCQATIATQPKTNYNRAKG